MSSKPQRIALDLERNEEVARIAADLSPGQTINAKLSVVAVDEKTLTVELVEIDEPGAEASGEKEAEAESADDEAGLGG